ncbi:MAG TPA: FAD-dependent oxidoreductase [bacterium]|nr:FAD-dependent oxidoreductase [bacterium]
MKHYLVLGGGFAGISAIRELRKQPDITITLIDQSERFVFTPWLIDALADERTLLDISADYESLSKKLGFTFVRGTVEQLEREDRQVTVTLTSGQKQTLSFDEAILTLGAKTCYYGIQGATANTLPLKNLQDVEHIHTHVRNAIKKALSASDTRTKQELLSFVMVGAGPTGVESAFALKKFVMQTLGDQWQRLAAYTHFYIVQGAPTILPGFNSHAINLATDELRKQGFELILGEPVETLEENTLHTTKGTVIHAATILWCAGVEPNFITVEPELPKERGGWISPNDLLLDDTIAGAGDNIRIMLGTLPAPKTAQIAMPMGKAAAQRIITKQKKAFTYVSKGAVLTLGETGLFDFGFLKVKTPLAKTVRSMLYRLRFNELTK